VNDQFYYQGQRRRLVETLQSKGITDEAVLKAISEVPRHLFFDPSFKNHAYQDKPFPIDAGQTISQPYTVARQTELLQCSKGDKVLEIGTGSGYQCAVLIAMGIQVFTIERQGKLFKQLQVKLPRLGYRPKKLVFGDGYVGLPEFAPFDGIIVTAGAAELPEKLLNQMAIGGRMVVPLGKKLQTMTLFKRQSGDEFSKSTHGEYRFVPMLGDRV
jgi:protein-L-isoaspartate(D-aspartate) O-methyltransferase